MNSPSPSVDPVRERITEIQQRADKATPAPWKTWAMSVLADPVGNSNLDDALPVADTYSPGTEKPRTFNADFIAAARADVPALLAALTAVLDRHRSYESRMFEGEIRCRECGQCWPCNSYSAVAAGLGVTP